MDDTRPEARRRFRQLLAERSNRDRFLMGNRMFESARQLVIASLPDGLGPEDTRCRLFSRFYGGDFSAAEIERIEKGLRVFSKRETAEGRP